jgi:pilus assembly protein CpaC
MPTRRTGFLQAGLIGLLGISPAFAGTDAVIHLGVGSQKVLSLPGVIRVAVGSSQVAEVKAIGNDQILVTGTGEGRTTLVVWRGTDKRKTYAVTVRRQDPSELYGEVRKLLGDRPGLSVRLMGERVVLEGQAQSSQDSEAVARVLNLYPTVRSFVSTGPDAKSGIALSMSQAFVRAGLSHVQVNVVGSTLFLEGAVESAQDLRKADLVAKALGEDVQNLLTVGLKRMVLSEVQFVEIRRSSRDRAGVKYPTDVTGSVTSALDLQRKLLGPLEGGFSAKVLGSSEFAAGFQLNDGVGRVLAQPRLLCASGEQAEFLAGGEIPIPLVTTTQLSVEYKQYGIILRIKPTADAFGNIQTEIEAEASEVDTSVAVSVGGSSSVPGFRTRKVKTNVTVRQGETIVLSGVFSHDEQKSVSKIPGIGQIPILGELFKNRGFDSAKRELVIFVTPRLVNPDSEKVRGLIEDVKERYKQARDDVGFNLLD